ncbi:hypothetical protein D0817_20235 [Flavobacterium cupreum]|uniref:Uncharacterized protein n=1 Tax=Flavobacterium cupreum TaxID=2133766 RepID=A0A434A2S0_9FLAO|nr:hypothetical protein [Flavobacterium cupreum]RUT68691.1 hypothetical protein D0817_20235 [Flavobacterium cupreum]
MIYDSLDIIPYKTFFKIAESGNIQLLSDTEKDPEVLAALWESLYQQHLDKDGSSAQEKKTFRISKEISSLEATYKIVIMSCDALRFDFNEELFKLLTIQYGYTLRIEDEEVYFQDIEQIVREASALKVKINVLSKLLPKIDQGQEYSIDDVMASYCSILEFQIGDFNSITYTAFFSYEKQVHAKVESIKQQNLKNKKNG